MHIQNTSVRALVSRIVDSTPPKREVKKFGHRLRSLCSGHCSARLDKKLLPSLILNSVYVLAENNYYEAVARTPYIVASGVQSLSKKAKEDLLKIACGGMWLSDSEDAALIKNLYNMYTEHVAVKTKALDEFRVFMSDTHKWLVVYYAGLGYLVTKLSITVEEFLRGNDNPKIEHIRPYMFYSSIEDMPEHMRTDLMDSLTFAKINASRNPQINWDSSWQKDVAPELPLAHPYTYASSGAAEYHGCTRNIILREVGAVLGHYQQRESGAVYALVDASEHPE
jgi:hypothetical protein